MALPAAIQRQEAEAEAIRAATYGLNPEEPTPDPGIPATPDEPTPEPTPPPPAPPVEPQPAAPVQTAPQPSVPVEDATYWRQRFETLAGKYDAEMPRLHQQLREQGEQLQQLLARPAEPAPAPGDSPAAQQDIENFGEDLVDFVRRVAREAAAVERAEVEKRFGAVVQQVERVEGHVVKTEVDKFWEAVIGLVPDWLTIDKTPAWIQWLDTTPEYSELTFRELAVQAINKGKPEKIAKLVDEWRKATGAVSTPASQPQPGPVLQLVPTPPQPTLAGQVAPSTVKSNGGAPVQKRMYTRAEYEAMYDVRNVQRFGEKQAAAMIAEADLAVAEGRIQW